MADTVIERMVTKYVNTLNHQPEDCRDARLAMLAAVLELREELVNRWGASLAASYIGIIIDEHERRSEVKRGDS